MKLYKLTDDKSRTRGGMKWGEGVMHAIPEDKQRTELCGPGILHAYKNANLALLLNPIHADFNTSRLWQAEGDIVTEDWGKCGCHELKILRRMALPKWYRSKHKRKLVSIAFAVLCAEAVLKYYEQHKPNDDRPRKAIEAAKEYLKHPNADAADAARAAARAAYAAARAAYAARAAARAAYAAYAAARYILTGDGSTPIIKEGEKCID